MKNNSNISNQIHSKICPLCSSITNQMLAKELRRGNGEVCYCAACDHGFLVQNEQIDAKTYYAKHYRKEYSHNAEAAATNARELFEVYRNYQEARLKIINPVLTSSTRLLEVGASSGQFLTHIKDRIDLVNAIELDKACCAFLNDELNIQTDSEYLENSMFANEKYEVVCAFQVMEHVEAPVSFLKGLRRATKPGGSIFIEVPNLRDPLLSVWDVVSYQKFFFHSAHLHYFTENSLRQVALEAGFQPDEIEINFTQDYNLLNHLHWIMNDGPQSNCHIGLNKVSFIGRNSEVATWLTQEMIELNSRYVAKLIAGKCTSNMMMTLIKK
ncbi:class I SAM-dependent methyltransferase [Candidatus Njordibacter sp. Uisw_039]|uniref:class I SAM-dependent methyltransferase n=1 Tax=Candidatus Njordibacter sp. Uisw_039 TaxID=3230972 RepID=UPI003D4219D2